MRNRMLGTIGVVVAVLLTGCGDDGGSDDADLGVGDVGTGEDYGTSPSAPSAPDGDDLLAVYLSGSGLNPDIVSDAEHDCMNSELLATYPDGFPDGFRQDSAVTEEVVETVDAAAEACDVVL